MPSDATAEPMKISDSPLLKGAKAFRRWGLSFWYLAVLADGTTPQKP